MSLSNVRLGVYGASGSGKTTFLRQTVLGNGLPVAAGSKLASLMQFSLSAEGRVLPTTASIESVEIKIDRTTYRIGDWKGADLSESVDRLDKDRWSSDTKNPMVRQIDRSAAFLFFFDPTARQTVDQIHKHHRKELLRAKQLVDYILQTRQNRLLPVLFVVTHQDRLRHDAELQRLTEKWIDELDDFIKESYDQLLLGYFPRSLVRKESVFHRVSSVEPQSAADLSEVFEKAGSLAELVRQFRRRDRKRARLFVVSFLLCTLLLLFVPILCLTSPAVQEMMRTVRNRTAPVWEHLPSLPASLVHETSALSEASIQLDPLFDPAFDWEEKTTASLNKSLFLLMKRLNKLEDDLETLDDNAPVKKESAKDYGARLDLWNRALEEIDRRFDADRPDSRSGRLLKLDRFSRLLSNLTDSPERVTPKFNDLLQKYWQCYRHTLVESFKMEIVLQREAGSSSPQLLSVLCQRLEKSFRDVSESPVRGVAGSPALKPEPGRTGPDEAAFSGVRLSDMNENAKETLKQDLRKTFIACRNFSDRYQVHVTIRSVDNATELDRGFSYRLKFYGGKQQNEVDIDLTISSGFDVRPIAFLPSRKEVTPSLVPDHPLQLELQRKSKGSRGDWERMTAWEISSKIHRAASLDCLGVRFYLRYENDENTRYALEGGGFKIDLAIRRPRIVPEFLWEITDFASEMDSFNKTTRQSEY